MEAAALPPARRVQITAVTHAILFGEANMCLDAVFRADHATCCALLRLFDPSSFSFSPQGHIGNKSRRRNFFSLLSRGTVCLTIPFRAVNVAGGREWNGDRLRVLRSG